MSSLKIQPALLIIDMQKCCIKEEKVFTHPKAVIDNLTRLATLFRTHGYPVIYPIIEHEPDGTTLPFEVKKVWSVKGSEDAKVLEEIKPQDRDIILPKIRLSAFFKTDLENILKQLAVNMVVLTGYQLSMCVYITALDCHQIGFARKVVMDATLDISERRFNDFLKFFEDYKYTISTEQIISNIEKGWCLGD